MSSVKCKYCSNNINKDKESHAKIKAGKTYRYAHIDCLLREKEEGKDVGEYEFIDPNNIVSCIYCKKSINKAAIDDYILVSNGKYAHKHCHDIEQIREKTPEEKLYEYVKHLFKVDYVPPRVKKQISQYVKEYNYTYSGMEKALYYFYELKGNNIEKANGGVGIIPYCYQEAYNYFYAQWLLQQKNSNVVIEQYKPDTIEVHIPSPTVYSYKKKLFSFLDEEIE